MPQNMKAPMKKAINTLEYLEKKELEDSSLGFLNKIEKQKSEDVKTSDMEKSHTNKESTNLEKSYVEMYKYQNFYNDIYKKEENYDFEDLSPSEDDYEEPIKTNKKKSLEQILRENNPELFNRSFDSVKSKYDSTTMSEKEYKELVATKQKEVEKKMNQMIDSKNEISVEKNHYNSLPSDLVEKKPLKVESSVGKYEKKSREQIWRENNPELFNRGESHYTTNTEKYSSAKNFNATPVDNTPFEKRKFLKANWFMKIGQYIGLSLRNEYYKNLDTEVTKALNNNEVYRVLEAQQNGYYLGKKLSKLTLEKVSNELINNPSPLIEELVKRDILLSNDKLSLIIFSHQGKELINNIYPEQHTYAKVLIQDLLKKENFLFANKDLWLNSLKDKDLFLKENNPLFYHEKMLAICDKSELSIVKKVLGEFLQQEDVLKSISKNKLIDKMLLKVDLLLGNSVDLDHMVLDLPKTAQSLYKSIKDIKFNEGDLKILQEAHSFDYDLVEKRVPEAVIKYLNVDSNHRTTLTNQNGKTAENLLIETLENILVLKKDLNLFVNQTKISELSVTRRYTDTIRGDIGKPSLFTLKTLQQLKDSGELTDLSNETIVETINDKNSSDNSKKSENHETISETKLTSEQLKAAQELAEKVKDVRMTTQKKISKKLKI